MKNHFILTLFLFSLGLSQENAFVGDVIQYGHNYTGDFKDGKRHGVGK